MPGPGPAKLWLQFQRNGRLTVASFVINVPSREPSAHQRRHYFALAPGLNFHIAATRQRHRASQPVSRRVARVEVTNPRNNLTLARRTPNSDSHGLAARRILLNSEERSRNRRNATSKPDLRVVPEAGGTNWLSPLAGAGAQLCPDLSIHAVLRRSPTQQ